MPLQKLEFRPGINKESTSYANEGGYYSCDKVRFRSGYAEKIGGWVNQTTNTFKGMCHTMWNWITFGGNNLLAVGTNTKYYIENSGTYHDVTPLAYSGTIANNPFSTTNGSLLVTVTHSGHASTIGTYVTFSNVSNSGVINGINFDGEFQIVGLPTSNTYEIVAPNAATSTGSGGGSLVIAQLDIEAGLSTYYGGVGWGMPPWGSGAWGSALPSGTEGRLWSQDNFTEDLIFNYRRGPIYYWPLDLANYARARLLSDIANETVRATTTAAFSLSVTTITVADPFGIESGAVLVGTGIASGTYVTTSYAGGTSVPISAPTTASAAISTITISYAGRHIPQQTYQVMTSSVSNFTICFGSNPYSPDTFTADFDPMLVRWSDADNVYDWVPATTNQSGEQILSHGSFIQCALDTRQEILIWTDAAIFSMQYLGPPYVWGINLLMDNISIISPNAAVPVNNVVYWMGVDKFYMYSGRVETLPCTLRQYVFTDINTSQYGQIVCGTNEGYNEIWWFYPSADSVVNNRYVIYNHLERVWYYGTMDRSAWLDSPGLRQYPLGCFSLENTYLASGTLSASATTIPILNASSYPNSGTITINSEQITYGSKGDTVFSDCVRGVNGTTATTHLGYSPVTFKIANQVLLHEIGNDDNSQSPAMPIEAHIESSDFDIQDGQSFGYVWRMLPDLTFSGSTAGSPSVTLTVRPRQNSGSNYTNADSPTVTRTATIPIQQYTGQVYTRVRGRQMAFRLDSTDLGVTWQMGAMRIDVRPDGRR
jgi:hypothetical protein